MKKEIFNFLRQYSSSEPKFVDSLIVTTYLEYNRLVVKTNLLILDHVISPVKSEESAIQKDFIELILSSSNTFDFEDLIELFEFVISPSDKIVNGAVYTPKHIRSYIVSETISRTPAGPFQLTAYDPACGCGGFLLTISSELKRLSNRSYKEIYKEQIFGIDITEYSINRAKLLLALQAIEVGEDTDFDFNFKVENSLTFKPKEGFKKKQIEDGFDIVIGNPPYVASRNMDEDTLKLALTWEVSRSGHPDLYIPFFQIGVEQLNETGILGYITVNTFIKSINGRALRQYFANEGLNLQIINFGGEQVFNERNTYTCICFITKNISQIKYKRTTSSKLSSLIIDTFHEYQYADLDHNSGWNLVNTIELDDFITKIENTGTPFETLFKTKNGIATLKNDIYKFKPTATDKNFYYLENEFGRYPIEINICRNVVNANKIKSDDDLTKIREKIIFPYQMVNGKLTIISERDMQQSYPSTYRYLLNQKEALSKRDKGNKKYEVWYAYGRRQSMDNYRYKLFFPHICERPTFVLCEEQDLLFYNGIAAICDELEPLLVLKKILESDVFYHYIRNTTKDYASGYISMSRNYLKKFGIPNLTETQRHELLDNPLPNAFLEAIYDVF
ncbi:HsdM family class I SAM-dependent methyltransferase [Mucilaginibacter sp.]